ncbi:MAG: hypothetical protein WCA78_15550 [Rhizomicrobium sp.]
MAGGGDGFDVRDDLPGADGPPAGDPAKRGGKRDAQRTVLHDMLTSGDIELWLCADNGEAMASVGPENMPVKSRPFEYFGQSEYTKRTGEPLGATRLGEFAALAIAGAVNGGRRFSPCRRWAETAGGDIACDLGGSDDPNRGYAVIDRNGGGWKIVEAVADVKFSRPADALAMPKPEHDAARVETLQEFLSLQSKDDLALAWAWLVCAARPGAKAYPIAALSGLQGAGKSSAARRLQDLVDPSGVTGRGLPREERDLAAAVAARHLVSFDNLSSLPTWLSDALARIATGGGFASRRLHTDADEHLTFAIRPVIVNGIADILGRADLADRTLRIELTPPETRRTDEELDKRWTEAWPGLLGLLLDGLSAGLRLFDKVEIVDPPRMASAARWATACAAGLGLAPESIAPAWRANRNAGDRAIIETDDVAIALISHLAACPEDIWRGTATQLLNELSSRVSERIARGRDWPATASALGLRLRRLAPALRAGANIEAKQARSGADGARIWTFRRI